MQQLALLLKTYEGDRDYARRLIESIHRFNRDSIPLYIVAPKEELKSFEEFSTAGAEIMSDESVSDCLAQDNSVFGIRPGYINQEIVKLAFWEKGLCENYLCVDSDGVFIRDFYKSDFMYDSEIPYSVLVEDKELIVDPEYFRQYWQGRFELLQIIKREIGLDDPRTLTCHGFAVFSSKVLRSFKEKYLERNGYTYLDALKKSPYEFSWYSFWLQKDKTIPIMFKEPFMKVFHNQSQHVDYLRKGIKLSDIARAYVGVVVNANYSRSFGLIRYEDNGAYKSNLSVREKVCSYLQRAVRRILRILSPMSIR